MNFTAYIERQKNIISDRHIVEIFLISKENISEGADSEKLLRDLSSIKGLNTNERMRFGRVV